MIKPTIKTILASKNFHEKGMLSRNQQNFTPCKDISFKVTVACLAQTIEVSSKNIHSP